MRIHKIDLHGEQLHVDLDHIQMVEPPKDTDYDYGFHMYMVLRDMPIFIAVEDRTLMLELRKRYVDEAFEILYTAWCGKKFEP